MARSLKTANLPIKELAYRNKAYVAEADLSQLVGSAPGPKYIEVKGCIFSVDACQGLESGTIAFNKPQREWAKLAVPDNVLVKPYVPSPGSDLGGLTVECEHFLKATDATPKVEIQEEDLEKVFRERFGAQVMTIGQTIALDYESTILKFTVQACVGIDLGGGKEVAKVSSGLFSDHTEVSFQSGASGKVQILSNKVQQRNIFRPDFNFEQLGIGGLSKEFGDIFRRAFAARVFPPSVVRDLGINQVRGMLLYGPPGTGKTLIARQLAKFLRAAEPKIVNGPEILNKYVGQSEENIRNLFADAEKEYKQKGENSQLHIVIFDEIDCICKSRGTARDSTGTSDGIVNQLLSKIDGVDSLNNILIIGMTNRIDLIDEAILRPGRLEVHVEISLPDKNGRIEILNIHTRSMREKGYLDKDVSVPAIAAQSKNFSGAELEGLVRSATSFALNRKVNVNDIANPKDLRDIRVTAEDFENALLEVKPKFGCHTDDFDACIGHGIVPYSPEFEHLLSTCKSLVEQVRTSDNTPLLSVLLQGPHGSGKTALAAHLAKESGYPFVRRIANEDFVGYSEQGKVNAISKIFDDAYKSQLSCIVLDDVERLMDHVRIGPRFSNLVLQSLFALLKKQPPKAKEAGRRLLVIASTSEPEFLEDSDLARVFNVALSIPLPRVAGHFQTVLQKLNGFMPETAAEISAELQNRRVGIRTLLLVAEMAVQRQNPVQKAVFMDCLSQTGAS